NAAQRRNCGERFHPVWCGRSLERTQQHPSISPDLIGVLLALFLPLWQSLMIKPFTIALDPFSWHVSTHPLGGYLGKDIQDIDHSLSNTQRAVECADLGQDMGRVGALPPAGFQPSPF